MGIETKIKNSHLLTEKFGCWPMFHDAEILELNLYRDIKNHGASLRASFWVFEITRETDNNGKLKLREESLVKICFQQITDLELANYNFQNALFGITINGMPETEKFEVKFSAAYGCEACFKCEAIEILSIQPWTKGSAIR